jgi:TetR/AcrR family transcriptional regulator, transcriptional repressor for nem operon
MYSTDMTTRERLITSTQQLLWERGYVGTSPRAILDRSGAGQGSLYHHFTGKAELALAAVDRSGEQLQAAAEVELAAAGTALERIAGWLNREREVLRGCPIGRLAQDPDVIADPDLRGAVSRPLDWMRERLTQVLAEGRAKGEFVAELNESDLAETLIAVLQGGYVLARAANSDEPFNRAVRGALALLAGQTVSNRESALPTES